MVSKDATIENILNKLRSKIDFGHIELVDYWDADLCAVGFRKSDRLVYISTWTYYDQEQLRYDYFFEIVNEEGETVSDAGKGVGVEEEELITVIKVFFGL